MEHPAQTKADWEDAGPADHPPSPEIPPLVESHPEVAAAFIRSCSTWQYHGTYSRAGEVHDFFVVSGFSNLEESSIRRRIAASLTGVDPDDITMISYAVHLSTNPTS